MSGKGVSGCPESRRSLGATEEGGADAQRKQRVSDIEQAVPAVYGAVDWLAWAEEFKEQGCS